MLEVNGFPMPRLWHWDFAKGSGVFCLLEPQGSNCIGFRRGPHLSPRRLYIQCSSQNPAKKFSLCEESCFTKLGQTELLELICILRNIHTPSLSLKLEHLKMFSNLSFLKSQLGKFSSKFPSNGCNGLFPEGEGCALRFLFLVFVFVLPHSTNQNETEAARFDRCSPPIYAL